MTDTPDDATQGWDSAEYLCSRCYTTVTARTEDGFTRAVAEHRDGCNPHAPAVARTVLGEVAE